MLRSLRVAGAIAAILTVAACGKPAADVAAPAITDTAYPGKSAAQVLDLARTALSEMDAVRLDGSVTGDGAAIAGTQTGPVSFTVNIVNGTGSIGTVKMGGGTLKMMMIGDQTYSRMDQKVLDQLGPLGTSIGVALGDKWLMASSDDVAGIASVSGFYQSASVMSSFSTAQSALEQSVPAGSTLTRVPGKVINGVETTGVRFTSSSSGTPSSTGGTQPASGTVFIAATGTPYPVSLERSDATLQLSHWNQKVLIKKPGKSDVVSVDQLGLSPAGLTSSLTDQLSGYTG